MKTLGNYIINKVIDKQSCIDLSIRFEFNKIWDAYSYEKLGQ